MRKKTSLLRAKVNEKIGAHARYHEKLSHGVRLLLAKMQLYVSAYRTALPECHCPGRWTCRVQHAAYTLCDFEAMLDETEGMLDYTASWSSHHWSTFDRGTTTFFRESRIFLEQLGFLTCTLGRDGGCAVRHS